MTSVQVYATVHNTPMPYIVLYNICQPLVSLINTNLSAKIGLNSSSSLGHVKIKGLNISVTTSAW